jgi:signal transduction histidine kinase
MVEDLRELTRIDQNELETEPIEIESTATQAWAHIDTPEATLQIAASDGIVADGEFLLHVFENLFRNSIDHGRADVTVRVGSLADGLYIEDDGPGIPEEDRQDVLEHGYSTSTDGTGLGMSIVRTIAEAHGWTITVSESTEGGARFELTNVDKPELSTKPKQATSK